MVVEYEVVRDSIILHLLFDASRKVPIIFDDGLIKIKEHEIGNRGALITTDLLEYALFSLISEGKSRR